MPHWISQPWQRSEMKTKGSDATAAHQPAGWQKPVRGIIRATRSIAQPRTKAANFTSGFC